jgi:integrase
VRAVARRGIPAVAVWTAAQLADFLRFVADDPWYPLWWLIALRGLRRGEAAGLGWCDLDHRQLTIVSQRTTVGSKVIEGEPKSAASQRAVALGRHTVTILRVHRRRHSRSRVPKIQIVEQLEQDGFVGRHIAGLGCRKRCECRAYILDLNGSTR